MGDECPLLTRGCSQTVPGVPHLVIMDVRQVIRRVEVERVHVKPTDRTQERIGRNDAVSLRHDLPGARIGQVLLSVQDIDSGALAALRFTPDPLKRHICRTHLGFGRAERDLGALIGYPGTNYRSAGLIPDLLEDKAALRGDLLRLTRLGGRHGHRRRSAR